MDGLCTIQTPCCGRQSTLKSVHAQDKKQVQRSMKYQIKTLTDDYLPTLVDISYIGWSEENVQI